jgi:hypothetical protein
VKVACLTKALRQLDSILLKAVATVPGDIDPLGSMRITQSEILSLLTHDTELSPQNHPSDEKFEIDSSWLPTTLVKCWELMPFDIVALLFALAPELDAKYERIFAYLQNDITLRRPTVRMVSKLLTNNDIECIKRLSHFLPGAPLLSSGLMHFEVNGFENTPLAGRMLLVNETILRLLLEDSCTDSLPPYCTWLEPEEGGSRNIEGTINSFLDITNPGSFWVWPIEGEVVDELLAEALARYSKPIIYVHLKEVVSLSNMSPHFMADEVMHMATMYESIIAVENAQLSATDEIAKEFISRLTTVASIQKVRLLVLSHLAPDKTLSKSINLQLVNLPLPERKQRELVWKKELERVNNQNELANVVPGLAKLLPLSSARIKMAVNRAQSEGTEVALHNRLIDAAISMYRSPSTLGRHVSIRSTWDDLVLTPATLRHLRELLNQIRIHETVRVSSSLAGGLVALLTGASGTGKTLSAEVIAGELGWDLFRISASQLYDKYVGETEKNIDQVFDLVEPVDHTKQTLGPQTILLIDEAEWLFSNRVKGGDSHDHYLNLRVGHLLQRLEAYRGVAILTSNLPENLDSAFKRRWFQHVSFEIPDEKIRYMLWQRILNQSGVSWEDINLDKLASAYPLSGGNIRNVVLLATYDAISNKSNIRIEYLCNALVREYRKLGHVFNYDEVYLNLANKEVGRLVMEKAS